ncbi:hypothetical protein ACOYXF_20415 [Pseudomonas sp. Tul1A2]
MVVTASSTKGKLEFTIDDREKVNAKSVTCNMYGPRFIELKGAVESDWELEVDIAHDEDIRQGVTYKIDRSTQSSAAYTKQGERWELQGKLELTTLNLKGGIVNFDFELNTSDNEHKKYVRGNGDFIGINQFSKKDSASGKL